MLGAAPGTGDAAVNRLKLLLSRRIRSGGRRQDKLTCHTLGGGRERLEGTNKTRGGGGG